jgi:hypothetical protein
MDEQMKLGIWHEAIVGKPGTDEDTFKDYAGQYIQFIKDNNIERAFFIMMDPRIPAGTYVKEGWLQKYWLEALPSTCQAGLVLDTEAQYPWPGAAPTFQPGDTMDMAFNIVDGMNKSSTGQKVTCLAFDYENVNVYYGKDGEAWIEELWAQYWPKVPLDYGYAPKGPPPNDQGNHSYPEIYWVGEMAACGCKGDEGPECQCPNTPYCKNNGDPAGMLSGPFGDYIENHKDWLSQPNVWPMFSLESLSKPACVAAPYTSHNACGIMDAFGTWSKADFLKFLDAVEAKYGIKQAMMYEWQYVPTAWLTEVTVEECGDALETPLPLLTQWWERIKGWVGCGAV